MKASKAKTLGKINFLLIAFILFVIGIVAHGYKQSVEFKNQSISDSYQAQLEYYNDNNIYYDAKATIKWLVARQHPKGYFVENPDSMDEPSQLNRNTLQATRHAVLTLYRLDGTWDFNKANTIDFVYSNYGTEIYKGAEVAGFRSIDGQPLGLRPTMDAMLTLWRLNAIDPARIDLEKVRQFILLHQNEDGGFWDPYYSLDNQDSCLRCTSFGLSALSIINGIIDNTESREFKNAVIRYIDSTWKENSHTYSDVTEESEHDSFDIFRAYLSVSSLKEGSVESRIEFAKNHFKADEQIQTIKDNFITSSGAFSHKYGSDTGSMKATHLLIWLFTDLDEMDHLDQKAIVNFVLANQTSPGEYGGDIYNTYSATSILKRLDVSTKPLEKPLEPELHWDPLPSFLPFIFYIMSIAAIAFYFIQNKKYLESRAEVLESKVQLDSLTGLYNREYLESSFESVMPNSEPISLILLDIDHFKAINDKHGHLIGDKALQRVARFISRNLGDTDTLARWGGEEFAILSKDTDQEAAFALAEKLRVLIEFKDIEFIGKLTCSFGVSQYRTGESFKDLFERTDKAMYLSKTEGRNRVTQL